MPKSTQEILEEIKLKWRGLVIVDDNFEDLSIKLNVDRISEWFIKEFSNALTLQEKEIRKQDEEELIKILDGEISTEDIISIIKDYYK